ncbi:MAG: GNAT family N-acetyltransferase [Planctomycetes bacterium]|nr:GNAT family N-acetyltransferase [Planctomycetota bacterium]
MPDYQLLPWDSDFFGFPVALIVAPELTVDRLEHALRDMARAPVKLAYWPADPVARGPSDEDIHRLGGMLVDRKTTFAKELRRAAGDSIGDTLPDGVERYRPEMGTSDLIGLAVAAGQHSRFAVDPHIPRRKFEELYSIWLLRSLAKERADEVLVVRRRAACAGFATVSERNGQGDIGLIAVGEAYRGQGIGGALVSAADWWFRRRGCTRAQVVTQEANAPACQLFARCGYTIEKVTPYYHFWLGVPDMMGERSDMIMS